MVTGVLAVIAALFVMSHHKSTPTSETVAVLPFLDLTSESMDQEYFADGLTEELIDRLSQVPGLRVPSASSSFYYKGKNLPVAAIARALGVHYLVDGSLRKSGSKLRIAARLLRADDGFVIWTETYERQAQDPLQAQDAMANEIIQALASTLRGGPAAPHS